MSVNIITELQSLPLKNAHFDFSNRHFASINLCFGVAPEAIVDGNVYMLSETLELLALEWDTAPKKVETEFTKLENRKLVMRFPLAKVPAGTSSADMESKITIFRLNPEIKLLVAQERTSIEFDEKKGEGTVSVSPNESGRFVVAYKP
ncbi:hypothetical protein CSQ89_03440 [Chitinimonas sp. BJB300]|nr:hypothetical protein CSQ89_03440 [Chitinimonas sp. BJB300]